MLHVEGALMHQLLLFIKGTDSRICNVVVEAKNGMIMFCREGYRPTFPSAMTYCLLGKIPVGHTCQYTLPPQVTSTCQQDNVQSLTIHTCEEMVSWTTSKTTTRCPIVPRYARPLLTDGHLRLMQAPEQFPSMTIPHAEFLDICCEMYAVEQVTVIFHAKEQEYAFHGVKEGVDLRITSAPPSSAAIGAYHVLAYQLKMLEPFLHLNQVKLVLLHACAMALVQDNVYLIMESQISRL